MAKNTTADVINISDTDEEHHDSPNISDMVEKCQNFPEKVLKYF